MRFWRWLSEPVPTARAWFYIAIGYSILSAVGLIMEFVA